MGLYPKVNIITVPLSFETDLQATIDVRFGSRVRILRAKSTVTKQLAGTDPGTVTFKNEAGDTLETITHAAAAALNSEQTVAFEPAVFVGRNSFLRLVPAKTTAGGTVTVQIEFQHVGN